MRCAGFAPRIGHARQTNVLATRQLENKIDTWFIPCMVWLGRQGPHCLLGATSQDSEAQRLQLLICKWCITAHVFCFAM